MDTVASRPSLALTSERANGITALRLFLAIAVVMSHAWTLGGFGPEPVQAFTGQHPGSTVAVMGFFGLSGYLLAASRQRSNAAAFMARRAFRILPGYWVSIALTAMFVGPRYLAYAPFPGPGAGGSINGALWTLFPEILCYIALALAPSRWLRIIVPCVVVAGTVIATDLLPVDFAAKLVGLFLAFGTGAIIATTRVRPSGRRVVGLLVVLAIANVDDRLWMLALPFVVAYASIWAGLRLPIRWERDLSYGTYIYAFPIAIGIAAVGGTAAGIVPYIALTLAVTIPIALASWELVERPAIALGRWTTSRRLADPDHLDRLAASAGHRLDRDLDVELSNESPAGRSLDSRLDVFLADDR